MRHATITILLLASGLACESPPPPESPASPSDATKPAPEAAPTPEPKPVESTPEPEPEPKPKPEPKPAGNLELPALGLRATAPAGTEVVPSSVEGGTLVRGPDLYVLVLEATKARPATLDEAKARVSRLSRRPTTETLPDGWVLTLRSTNDLGPVLVAQVRRELSGVAVWCEGVGASVLQRDNAVAFCKSLVPSSG